MSRPRRLGKLETYKRRYTTDTAYKFCDTSFTAQVFGAGSFKSEEAYRRDCQLVWHYGLAEGNNIIDRNVIEVSSLSGGVGGGGGVGGVGGVG